MVNNNVIKCRCGANLEQRPRSYTCSSCGLILWHDVLKNFGREKISESEIEKLCAGEQIELKGLIGKSGKPFDCLGELDEWTGRDGKKRNSIKLIFPERPAAAVATPTAPASAAEAETTESEEDY